MTLLASWNPTFAFFKAPYEWGAFSADLQRFGRVIKGTTEAMPRITIKPTVRDIKALLKEANNVVGCDIETGPAHPDMPWTGKNPTQAKLRCISLGSEHWGLAYWWGTDTQVQGAIIRVLEDERVTKVFHNGWFFDIPVLKRHGINVK